jgi:CelD/BcsL family acetyltransferase involved in cellulose biosynthesis
MNFDYGEKILVYNSGINTLFENLSPGWVLLARVIQRAIQQGRRELDFLRGDEEYKYQFGGKDKYLIKVEIQRS